MPTFHGISWLFDTLKPDLFCLATRHCVNSAEHTSDKILLTPMATRGKGNLVQCFIWDPESGALWRDF